MKKLVIFLLTLCVVTAGVLETSAVLFKNDVYAETKSTSDQVAQDSEKGARTDVSNPDLKELTGKDIKDGTYDIEVESDSSMFNIIKAKLTVKDGKMTAVLTLNGKGYLRLFMGTGEEAVKADESKYAEFKIVDDKYTYEVSVDKLNAPVECTSFSKRKQKWYDHQIVFLADTLPEGAVKKDYTVVILCAVVGVVLVVGIIIGLGRTKKKKSAR